MAELRREVGFLNALAKSKLRSLLWPEGTLALLVGGGGAAAAVAYSDIEARLRLAGDAIAVLPPLLGVVVAAMAVVVAVSPDYHLLALQQMRQDVMAFYRPFIIAIGFEVSTICLALVYRGAASELSRKLEAIGFGILGFFVVFCILDILAIGRSVMMHAKLRADIVKKIHD